MPDIRLLEAENTREELTKAQERHIRKLYKEALKDVQEWSKSLENKDNVSSAIRRSYLDQMEKELLAEIDKIGNNTEKDIRRNMYSTATAVVKDANRMLNDMGINIHTAYSFVPTDVVQAITTGRIYGGDWSLSNAIWGMNKKTQKDIHDIIAKGVLENKSSYEIAKALEKYVNPSAAKPWNWSKLYPGSSKKVDYNAQRLARTMVSHAYQQSFIRTTKNNPFFVGYRWLTSGAHNVCPICRGYAEDIHDDKLPAGVFPKDDLPIDHPNGKCTFSVYMTQSTDEIVNSLVDWAHGKENPDLDTFAESLGLSVNDVKKSVSVPPSKAPQTQTFDIQSVSSSDQISSQMSANSWFLGTPDLSGCDVESAKVVYTAYERVFERYPSLIGKFDAPTSLSVDSSVYASTQTFVNGKVNLNSKFFSNSDTLTARIKSDIKMSFHPEVDSGRELESIVTHEIGHSIDGYLTSRGYHVQLGTTDRPSSSVWIYENTLERGDLSSRPIGWQVSSYARKNEREFFAECFTQGINSAEGSAYSREFMQLLDEAIKEVSK